MIENTFEYFVDKLSSPSLANTNCVYVKSKKCNYVRITFGVKQAVFKVLEDDTIKSLGTICLNSYQRAYLNCELGSKVKIKFILSYSYVVNSNDLIHNEYDNYEEIKTITFIVKNISVKSNPFIVISDEVIQEIKDALVKIPIINDLQLTFKSKLCMYPSNIESNNSVKIIGSNTEIKLLSTDNSIEIDASATKELFKANFNFLEMGIGGLDKQFELVFRRAFSSRLIPEKVLKNLGINHVRGLMLYGLPGCGKTLIARQIGKILNCEEPKIVSGPSLLSSYQGKSEENVRNLFSDAFADKYGKKLHLIILDEFDAISRKRGTINDNGLSDKLVNQFLSMIDGPESLNNILLIAMTNRLELIDEALLRPGRFEVQIEVGLPDEKGRNDILKIHTNKMNKAGYLQNVNLSEIATLTKNFTGAELETVVKTAVSYCISKDLDPNNLAAIKDISPVITQIEMVRAVREIKPQFGSVSKEIDIITSESFELYSQEYEHIYSDVLDKIKKLTCGKNLSILIQGEHFIGKTTLACQIAKNCSMNCIKFINSETLINNTYKENKIYEIFEQGYKSESFVLVLDGVEKIIEYSKLGNIYNNKILQTIYTILTKIIDSNKKVVIILTSSNDMLMDMLELNTLCTYSYTLFDILTELTQNKLVSTYFKEKKFIN